MRQLVEEGRRRKSILLFFVRNPLQEQRAGSCV
jgi:hypothetical protein